MSHTNETEVVWVETARREPDKLSEEYLITLDEDSEEATTAVYGRPQGRVGFYKMENGRLTRVEPIAWAEMPKPYRPA